MLIAMSAVQMQVLMQILIQVTMDHARYQRQHVIMMPFILVLPGFQLTSSRRLSMSPPSMHGCLSIPSFENAFKSPNPAVNVQRHDKPVATDTIQSNVPAIDGGEKYVQIFVGMKSLITDIHGMKSLAQFPGILTDEIITCSAPTKLISDSACVKTSKEIRGILRTYHRFRIA
jgi:hypothetical protein